MLDKIRRVLAVVWTFLKKVWGCIGKVFYKIFPRRAAKYFDADRHEIKYIGLMALYALLICLYIEEFARLTTGPLEGIRWAVTHPVIFLYNTLIIFATMTLALLFKRRRFVWFIISVIWLGIGTANGVILMSRMTPFTLYDLQNYNRDHRRTADRDHDAREVAEIRSAVDLCGAVELIGNLREVFL